jgi:uncharacterized membrane protein YhaH (DUF805 family)
MILPTQLHWLAEKLKLFTKSRYYITLAVILALVTPLSYLGFSFADENALFERYSKLDEPLKDYLSLETWWIETIISLTVPVFMSVALSIQLARLHDKDAETIKSIFSWVPKVRDFFSVKMPIFFVFTASVLFGAFGLLAFGGKSLNYSALLMTIYPMLILLLSEFMRNALSSNPSEGKLGKLTMTYHKGLTKISISIAALAWLYSDIITPIKNRWNIFDYAQSLL